MLIQIATLCFIITQRNQILSCAILKPAYSLLQMLTHLLLNFGDTEAKYDTKRRKRLTPMSQRNTAIKIIQSKHF